MNMTYRELLAELIVLNSKPETDALLDDTVTVQSNSHPCECFPIRTLAQIKDNHILTGVLDDNHLVLEPERL
jgi:hypothetical protein